MPTTLLNNFILQCLNVIVKEKSSRQIMNSMNVDDMFSTSFENFFKLSGIYEYKEEIAFVSPLYELITLRENPLLVLDALKPIETFANPGLIFYLSLCSALLDRSDEKYE